jgi:hypothetical protein
MRWLALALIVANAVFFGWRYQERLEHAASERAAPPPLPPGAPSLTLLSELDQLPPARTAAEAPQASAPQSLPAQNDTLGEVESRAAEAPPSASPGTDQAVVGNGVASGICVNVGPFSTSKDTDEMEAWLATRAAALHRVAETVRSRRFFWVYLSPTSREDAQQKLADLERKGVRDVLMIRRDGLQNAISLGLFTSQDSVNRRLAEVKKQGYQPIVVPRVENTERYWLRANLAVGFDDAGAIPQDRLAGGTVEIIDCGKIADPPGSS